MKTLEQIKEMQYYHIDWENIIIVVKDAIIPILGLIVAILALYYHRIRIKINLFAVAEQQPNKNYSWSVSLTIANSGFTTELIESIVFLFEIELMEVY